MFPNISAKFNDPVFLTRQIRFVRKICRVLFFPAFGYDCFMALSGISPPRLWVSIALIVVVILGAIQLLRVNPPAAKRAAELPVRYSQGEIVKGNILVEPGRLLSFPIKLNRKKRLTGSFTVLTKKAAAACMVLRESEFERLQSGGVFNPLASTGYLPRGIVTLALEPGNYQLVFDNRDARQGTLEIYTELKLE